MAVAQAVAGQVDMAILSAVKLPNSVVTHQTSCSPASS